MRGAEVGAAILGGSLAGRYIGMLAWRLTVWLRRAAHREVVVARSCWCPIGWPHLNNCAAGRGEGQRTTAAAETRSLRPDWRHFVPGSPLPYGRDRRSDLN